MYFQVLQGVLRWVNWGRALQLVWLFCWVAPWRCHESGRALQSSLMDVSTGAFPRNHSNGRPGAFPWDCSSAPLELAECPGSEMYKFSEPRASLSPCAFQNTNVPLLKTHRISMGCRMNRKPRPRVYIIGIQLVNT